MPASKGERLEIEGTVRKAFAAMLNCPVDRLSPVRSGQQPDRAHEFDLYARDVMIGGVTTSRLTTSGGHRNTGATDRVAHELLWLTLWVGPERRVHCMTDRVLVDWVWAKYCDQPWQRPIELWHFDVPTAALQQIGFLPDGLSQK